MCAVKKPTPEKLEKIIKMAGRCASPLPWEVDINRANETIFELWTALEALQAYCIPGMNWTGEVGQALLDLAEEALAAAKEVDRG